MACVVQPGNPGGFQKVFFGREEVAIPVQGTVLEAVKAYPRADVFINFASFRRCTADSLSGQTQRLHSCCDARRTVSRMELAARPALPGSNQAHLCQAHRSP